MISPAKNLWHCMGACAAGGSVIDWAMRAEGVSFRHAVELLRNGATTSSDGPTPKRTSVPKLSARFDVSVEDRELLAKVVGFYHQTLRESPDAIAFLERRRIAHPEAVERFRGFLQVGTDPSCQPGAVISVDGAVRDNATVYTDLAPGTYTVCWGALAGRVAPPCRAVGVNPGALTTVIGTYRDP